MLVFIGLTHFVTAVALSKDYVYESSAHIAGMPVISYSLVAHGIIALGARATGVIAMGGIAVGVIAIGGVAVGILSVGGLSVGVLALGAIALGWRAFGGLAVGQAALGVWRLATTLMPATAPRMKWWKPAGGRKNI